jgi:hypothetical protein
MESIWNPWNTCGIFHVNSMWIFHGFHGFQVDSTHSMWNMHGTKTPIWVGFHPKHIPYEWVESIWNDMDSIWIPCGMWGQGKDLPFFWIVSRGKKKEIDTNKILKRLA